MAKSHEDFLALLERGKVATGDALRELASFETDDLDQIIEARGGDWNVESAPEYDADALKTHVEANRDLLKSWAAEAREVQMTDDPKLAALRQELLRILHDAEESVGDETQHAQANSRDSQSRVAEVYVVHDAFLMWGAYPKSQRKMVRYGISGRVIERANAARLPWDLCGYWKMRPGL